VPVDRYRAAIGRLFAPMTEVAAANPHAWFRTVRTPAELVEVTPTNRLVAHPYSKLVTAIMDVDLAAAFVVASEDAADRLGVPGDRRVYVRGWAEDRDPDYVAEHDELWRSPAMASTFRAALGAAGLGVDDVARFDLYSCFPSSVAFSLDALGLHPTDDRAPFTVTGGLPYAGGPGSGYAVGSVAAMAEALVDDPGSVGMVTAVGMHLSKHAAVVLSTDPGAAVAEAAAPPAATLAATAAATLAATAAPTPTAPTPAAATPTSTDLEARPRRPIIDAVDGPATIAAYTVHHGSDGTPTEALLVCDLPGGPARCYARTTDAGLMAAMEDEEFVGRRIDLRHDGSVNTALDAI
jgi:acetyl-CoA C-acetyltransferase